MRALIVPITFTTIVQALASMTVFTPAVLAPVAQDEIGVTASAIGVFTALIYIAATLSAPLGGALVARHGPVRVSQHSLLWSGAGLALFASAVPVVIAAGALLIGVGYGPVTPASSTILVKRAPDRLRNLIMSIRQTGVPLGGAFAGALVPVLIVACGWRAAALVIAVSCALLAITLQPLREQYDGERVSTRRPAHGSHLASLRMVFGHDKLRQTTLASFTYSGIQMCLGSYLVVFLTERAGLSLVNAGAAFSAAMIGGIVGRVLWGAIADYLFSARITLGWLGVIMALCAFTITQVTPVWPYPAVVALCVVFGGSAFGWNGVFIAEVARVAPEGQVAQATGAVLGFTYFGVVLMPFLFWLIVAASSSYALAFVVVGMLTLAAGMSYFFVRPTPRAA